MVRAQTKAMESGEDVSGAIARGARGAAEEACGILRRQVVDTPPGETEGGGSGSGSLFESPGDLNVDWDVLVSSSFSVVLWVVCVIVLMGMKRCKILVWILIWRTHGCWIVGRISDHLLH